MQWNRDHNVWGWHKLDEHVSEALLISNTVMANWKWQKQLAGVNLTAGRVQGRRHRSGWSGLNLTTFSNLK